MVNYFELYGIPVSFHPDPEVIRNKYYELSRMHHPDRQAKAGDEAIGEALELSAVNNSAYKTLRNADATMAYLLKINGLLEEEEKYALPAAFLMEMMDINEALSDYEADPTNEDARNMAENSLNEQLELWEDATEVLTSRYEKGNHSTELLLEIKDQYFRKKYLLRIKERIDRFAAR